MNLIVMDGSFHSSLSRGIVDVDFPLLAELKVTLFMPIEDQLFLGGYGRR